MRNRLFVGGKLVTSEGVVDADLMVENGKIVQIAAPGTISCESRVDVSGKYLIPGGVDVHTHLDAPIGGTRTADTFSSGTVAAAVGGTTTIIDYAPQPADGTLWSAFEQWSAKAEHEAAIDYSFHVILSRLYDDTAADMRGLVREGITSFKVFMAYKGSVMLNDGELFEVLQDAGEVGATVCIHAENGEIIDRLAADLVKEGKIGPRYHALSRPPETEVEAVNRAIMIAQLADAPAYFVHLSTTGAVDAVDRARRIGLPISGETCTHYLTLGSDKYDAAGFEAAKFVLTPPLRDDHHREALWNSLDRGTIDIVSSDHCPFCFETQKVLGKDDFRTIPNGGAGIEHRMLVLYSEGVASGRMSLQRFVEIASQKPAEEFGLYPQKGTLSVGSDADIVVLDPEGSTFISAESQYQQVDYAMWEGWTVQGSIDAVYSRGELVAQNGKYVGKSGHGRFVPRSSAA